MATISRKNKKFANRKRNALTYNIYYSLFGVYERDGYDKAKEYALSAKLR